MRLGLITNLILSAASVMLSGCGTQALKDLENVVVGGNVVLRVYVVRHAEAYKNIPHRADTPDEKLDSLTRRGLRQADAAGEFLAAREVVAVIASPTGRTRQTADAIGSTIGLGELYIEDSAFASLRNGKAPNGKATSWSWRKEELKAGRDPRPLGGESFQDGVVRATGAINEIAEKYPGEAVAIVTHGDICAVLLGYAGRTSIYKSHQLHDVATGSVSEIVITDMGWRLLEQGIKLAQK